MQDIGTGTRTVIAVVAAEMLGLKPEQITVRVGDTNFPPGPGSGGSTTCASISPTVYDICTKALQQLQTQSGIADARGENWFAACKKLGVNPLVVHGKWQQGLSTDHAVRRAIRRSGGGHGNRSGHGEKNRSPSTTAA